MTKVTVNLVAGVLLAGSIIVLAVLRLTFVPPSYFFEGDDAALAVGVARMCEKDEIGPYFMQPPPVQVLVFAITDTVLCPECIFWVN